MFVWRFTFTFGCWVQSYHSFKHPTPPYPHPVWYLFQSNSSQGSNCLNVAVWAEEEECFYFSVAVVWKVFSQSIYIDDGCRKHGVCHFKPSWWYRVEPNDFFYIKKKVFSQDSCIPNILQVLMQCRVHVYLYVKFLLLFC